MNKKAQMIGQIFTFILAGIILILILGYGYKAVTYILTKQTQVQQLDFKTEIEQTIDSVKYDFGTVRKLQPKIPNVQAICFFDPQTCAKTESPSFQTPTQTLTLDFAQIACQLKTANIITIPRTQDIYRKDIQVPQGHLCVVPGTPLRIEGTGKTAKIQQWQ